MKKFFKEFTLETILVISSIVFMLGLLVMPVIQARRAAEKGYEAARMGVPVIANPCEKGSEAEAWLEGYMKYKNSNLKTNTNTNWNLDPSTMPN